MFLECVTCPSVTLNSSPHQQADETICNIFVLAAGTKRISSWSINNFTFYRARHWRVTSIKVLHPSNACCCHCCLEWSWSDSWSRSKTSQCSRPSLSISLRQTICALLLMRVPVFVPDSPSQLPFNLEYAKKGCEPWRKRLHGRWKARQTKDKPALLLRRPWRWLWRRRFLTTNAAWIELIPLVIPLVFTRYTAKCSESLGLKVANI